MAAWEVVPELEEIVCANSYTVGDGITDVGPVIEALSRGVAFQRLQKLTLGGLNLGLACWDLLLCALARATCAAHLTSLELLDSKMCFVNAQSLGPAWQGHLSYA